MQTRQGEANKKMTSTETIIGRSLWQEAWRRLLRNRLAVFGMILVAIVVLGALGPRGHLLGNSFQYDYIPPDSDLVRSFPPSCSIRWERTSPDATFWRASCSADEFR